MGLGKHCLILGIVLSLRSVSYGDELSGDSYRVLLDSETGKVSNIFYVFRHNSDPKLEYWYPIQTNVNEHAQVVRAHDVDVDRFKVVYQLPEDFDQKLLLSEKKKKAVEFKNLVMSIEKAFKLDPELRSLRSVNARPFSRTVTKILINQDPALKAELINTVLPDSHALYAVLDKNPDEGPLSLFDLHVFLTTSDLSSLRPEEQSALLPSLSDIQLLYLESSQRMIQFWQLNIQAQLSAQ